MNSQEKASLSTHTIEQATQYIPQRMLEGQPGKQFGPLVVRVGMIFS